MSQAAAQIQFGHPLDPLLKPNSIALLGASRRPDSPGRILADLIINSDYAREVFPVNPGYDNLLDRPCYPDLATLPKTVEHVVIAVSNERLEQAIDDVIVHGANAATIYSNCIIEGETNPVLLERITAKARAAGLAICGSNCMGFYNVSHHLYAGIFPAPTPIPSGGVSFIAQSGSAFTALAHNGCRLKFNLCVSSGNEMTTTVGNYMDWCLAQGETRVIGLFLETVRDPSSFVSALARAAEQNIPVVVLKVAKTALSAKMAQSHTGAIAGDHAAYEAVFDHYGVIEVNDFGELFATLMMFQSDRSVGPGGLATIQESGGFREMVTDIAAQVGVEYAEISDTTKSQMQTHLEPGLIAENPLDAWGSNDNYEFRFEACLDLLMQDPSVAVGIFFTNFRDGYYLSEGLYRGLHRVSERISKPVIMANCHTDLANRRFCQRSADADIPMVDGVRETLVAVQHAFNHRDRIILENRCDVENFPEPDVINRWQKKLTNSKSPLPEAEAMNLLTDFSICTPEVIEARNLDSLLHAARKIGFPLALKTAVSGIVHKTDQGGVVIGISGEDELILHFQDFEKRLGPSVLVCEMIEPGTEVGLGIVNDPQFGPFIMVAAGGALIELLSERALSLIPVSRVKADELVSRLKINTLIEGVRGRKKGQREALLDAIVALSNIAHSLRNCLQEVDINPVIVNERGAFAVDALVVGVACNKNAK